MRNDKDKYHLIQTQSFALIHEIEDEPLYYIGTGMADKRLQKLLLAASSIHAIVIQSLQIGNEKKALRYLLLLKKVAVEVRGSKDTIEEAINHRFEKHHKLSEQLNK